MKSFEGCTVLITGASAGLGAEFAVQLAPYAANLVLVARRKDRLEQLRYEFSTQYPEASVYVYQADLTKDQEMIELVAWLKKHDLNIDFLINNAGLGDHGDFAAGSWDKIRSIIEVNILALTRLTHLLLPNMKTLDHAAILNVGSIAGMIPLPGSTVYAATKAYVQSFTEALRLELKNSNVSVTLLCPGPVETEFFDVAARKNQPSLLESDPTRHTFVVTAEQVVRQGLLAVSQNRPKIIPGPIVCIAITLATLIPLFMLRIILQKRYDEEITSGTV